ncbi:MAG: transcription elongation factor GreA [Mucinivorans sp.]
MATINHITKEGLQKIQEELDNLRAQRPVISAQIGEARDKGDLSENAEYDAAKEAQGLLEMRIAKMEHIVSTSRIIDSSKLDTETIQILNRVTIKNCALGKIMEYVLVSENEADLKAGKLSISTPIARALLGKKRGDVVNVKVPSGIMKIEVMEVSI